MDFQEKQKEIINLRKEIEEKIKTLERKQQNLTKDITLGMRFCKAGPTPQTQIKKDEYTIYNIKAKEAVFPYTEVWISNYHSQNSLRITDIEIIGGIYNGTDSLKSV